MPVIRISEDAYSKIRVMIAKEIMKNPLKKITASDIIEELIAKESFVRVYPK